MTKKVRAFISAGMKRFSGTCIALQTRSSSVIADNADSSDSRPAHKSVKMTIVECDEGPRPTGFVNPSGTRALYSELEVDKSL
jgi:hypothetical protein